MSHRSSETLLHSDSTMYANKSSDTNNITIISAETKPQKRRSKGERRKKKAKDKPKRPLSAYNFFFKDQREKILSASEGTFDDDDMIEDFDDLEESSKNDKDDDESNIEKEARKTKRPKINVVADTAKSITHSKNSPKNEGSRKIGFEKLARIIGKRWKVVDKKSLEHYQTLADAEMEKYKIAMKKYNEKLTSEVEKNDNCTLFKPEDGSFRNEMRSFDRLSHHLDPLAVTFRSSIESNDVALSSEGGNVGLENAALICAAMGESPQVPCSLYSGSPRDCALENTLHASQYFHGSSTQQQTMHHSHRQMSRGFSIPVDPSYLTRNTLLSQSFEQNQGLLSSAPTIERSLRRPSTGLLGPYLPLNDADFVLALHRLQASLHAQESRRLSVPSSFLDTRDNGIVNQGLLLNPGMLANQLYEDDESGRIRRIIQLQNRIKNMENILRYKSM